MSDGAKIGSLFSSITVFFSSITVLLTVHNKVDHAQTQCSYGEFVSLLSHDKAIVHQIKCINKEYGDTPGFRVECVDHIENVGDITYADDQVIEITEENIIGYDSNGNPVYGIPVEKKDVERYVDIITYVNDEEIGTVTLSR